MGVQVDNLMALETHKIQAARGPATNNACTLRPLKQVLELWHIPGIDLHSAFCESSNERLSTGF